MRTLLWNNFVGVNNCSKEVKDTLLNEAYKRIYWAFFSAINSLKVSDYKIFLKYLDKNRHLLDNCSSEKSYVYKLCFCISKNNPYLGYGIFKMQKILRKCVSKILRIIKKFLKRSFYGYGLFFLMSKVR